MATPPGEIQISAVVSRSTKEMLEAMAKARGLKKGRLVEDALRHHLQALQELPDDVIIPSTLILSKDSFEEAAREIASPPPPTPALRKLMKRRRGH